MKEIFNNIVKWLKKHNREVLLNRLEKGDNKIYDKILKKTDLKITNELVELYKLSQGTKWIKGDILNDIYFFPGFYLIDIDEAVIMYNNYKDDSRWDANWFPVFANGGGDFYCVDCSDKNKSPIVEFMLDYDTEIVHKSIINMLKTIDECYAKGTYFINEKNYLKIDYDKEEIIRKRINEYA